MKLLAETSVTSAPSSLVFNLEGVEGEAGGDGGQQEGHGQGEQVEPATAGYMGTHIRV